MPLWTPTAGPAIQFAVAHRAAADLPQTTLGPLFAVVGGLVRVSIMGRVTTALGATSNSAKIVADPTAGTDTDLCVATNLNGLALGWWFYPYNTVAGLLLSSTSGALGLSWSSSFIVAPGNISMNTTANQSGQVEFWCAWYALDSGAYIVSV